MKLALLFALLTSFSAFAQTNSATTAPAQDSMGAPAAGEASMAQESKPMKKHKKAHHAKKKHHKKKKAQPAM